MKINVVRLRDGQNALVEIVARLAELETGALAEQDGKR